MNDLKELIAKGHVTKTFDGSTLPADKIEAFLAFLHSTPASLNIQAIHYLVASTAEARARIAKSLVGGFEANAIKIESASHVLAFCTRMEVSDEHLAAVFDQEHADKKFPNDAQEQRWRDIVRGGLDMHIYDKRDLSHWLEKQTYLAMGMAMMAGAMLDIDVTPMEGFFAKSLDEEFGLREKGFTGTLLLAIGKRDPNDWILKVPKSRFPAAKIFTFLD
jgi:nitroreductase/dihydropteridine reductase